MSKSILSNINLPQDLKGLTHEQLLQLVQELRQSIIEFVAVKEGHLGASLGVVELTVALHYVFNTPTDKLIWDVGHQAYGHKLLTGRKDRFHTYRQLNGLSGFPSREESEYDPFGVGHSSTSISAALGMALAAQLKGDKERCHIAVIGDASIASGMAFEGLNHAGVTGANLLIILNDNAIGIDPSVGALKKYFTGVKEGKKASQNNIIKALGVNYSGPIDGHDLSALISELERLKNVEGPRFLHVITTKGKGLQKAEENQVVYHAPGKFNPLTGEQIKKETAPLPPKFQDVFGLTLLDLAKANKNIVAITPAMPTGSSLNYMIEAFPDRAIDVGIAEQHAVTLAAGMAAEGMNVFCVIYSTFLQRAYDQVIHDVALQNLPVVFCIDRAGIVGEDGATHHGVFDIAFLRAIPNMIVYAPRNEMELRNMLYTCQKGVSHPTAIRYPRGRGQLLDWEKPYLDIVIGQAKCLKKGNRIAVLTNGVIGTVVEKLLEENQAFDEAIAHYDFAFVKPLDKETLSSIFSHFDTLVTIEEGVLTGGFGSAIIEEAQEFNYKGKIKRLGVPDQFVKHGSVHELKSQCKLTGKDIIELLNKLLEK
ncbi:MAG: 1-deoxy-D-xylulose-5-phosphate synthase [Flavobacteriales bacterium]|nr:1-deoxy-D-xylulose-5-phosphate synthase [Flavobacteriales bacterium]